MVWGQRINTDNGPDKYTCMFSFFSRYGILVAIIWALCGAPMKEDSVQKEEDLFICGTWAATVGLFNYFSTP